MTAHLTLYSTSHCHLCEEAEAILRILSRQYDIAWQAVEITDDDGLYERYQLSIPVVHALDTTTDIGWPFTAEDLIAGLHLSLRPSDNEYSA